MVRNINDFFPRKSDLGNGPIEVVLGDVLDKTSLAVAMEDCLSCIDCHGTNRLVQPRDLWTHPRKDEAKTHPYYVNYMGTKNLIEAAEKAGVKRLVRITGLSCGLSAFNPFTYLLNLLVSMAIKWQFEGEKEMRAAAERGLAYTVIRPGSLTDKPRPKDACLMLECDGKPTSMLKARPMYTISRKEVADLMVLAMQSKNAAGATLSCSWGKDKNGPKNWKSLMAKVRPDKSPLPERNYRASMAFLGSITLAVALAVGSKVAILVNFIADQKRKSAYR
ncbi:unnamed protein product [Ascophyllum nodosum]